MTALQIRIIRPAINLFISDFKWIKHTARLFFKLIKICTALFGLYVYWFLFISPPVRLFATTTISPIVNNLPKLFGGKNWWWRHIYFYPNYSCEFKCIFSYFE